MYVPYTEALADPAAVSRPLAPSNPSEPLTTPTSPLRSSVRTPRQDEHQRGRYSCSAGDSSCLVQAGSPAQN